MSFSSCTSINTFDFSTLYTTIAHSKHLSSPPAFSGAPAAWSLVFCIVLCRSLFSFCPIYINYSNNDIKCLEVINNSDVNIAVYHSDYVTTYSFLPLRTLTDFEKVWFNALEDITNSNADIAFIKAAFTDYQTIYWVVRNWQFWYHYIKYIVSMEIVQQCSIKHIVKPAHAVTSIKQSPVLKGHLLIHIWLY